MGVAGAGRPQTPLNRRSLIICAIKPWITSMVVLQASLVALPSLSSVLFSWGSAPATINPPRPRKKNWYVIQLQYALLSSLLNVNKQTSAPFHEDRSYSLTVCIEKGLPFKNCKWYPCVLATELYLYHWLNRWNYYTNYENTKRADFNKDHPRNQSNYDFACK